MGMDMGDHRDAPVSTADHIHFDHYQAYKAHEDRRTRKDGDGVNT